MIKIGTSNVPPNVLPAHIVIEDLDVRSAHASYSFTDDQGATRTYASNAAAIYVERAQHLVIRDCVLSDSGNGLFIGAFDGDTQDVLIEGNWIRGNGNVGSAFEHNTYTAAIGIVYQAQSLRAAARGRGRQQPEGPLGGPRRPLQLDRGRQPPARPGRRRGQRRAREPPELRRDLRLRQRADRAGRRRQQPDRPLRRRQRRHGDLPQGHAPLLPQHGRVDCAAATRRCCGSRPTTRAPTCATTCST